MKYTYHNNHIDDDYNHIRRHNKTEKRRQSTKPRALIADDDHQAALLLQFVLQNFGFETVLVFNGKEALRQMQMAHNPFDLIFLDIFMPELTGPAVLSKIEAIQKQNLENLKKWRNLPVVIYSAYEQDKLALPMENGFNIVGHWQKPMALSELTIMTSKAMTRLHISPPE